MQNGAFEKDYYLAKYRRKNEVKLCYSYIEGHKSQAFCESAPTHSVWQNLRSRDSTTHYYLHHLPYWLPSKKRIKCLLSMHAKYFIPFRFFIEFISLIFFKLWLYVNFCNFTRTKGFIFNLRLQMPLEFTYTLSVVLGSSLLK